MSSSSKPQSGDSGGMESFLKTALKEILRKSKSKHKLLRNECNNILKLLKERELMVKKGLAGSSVNADKYFLPFYLACVAGNTNTRIYALDCIHKLSSWGYLVGMSVCDAAQYPDLPDGPSRRVLIDVIIHCIFTCSFSLDEKTQRNALMALLTCVNGVAVNVHDKSLILALRACFYIYLMSKNIVNRSTAEATLTQILNTVFRRREYFYAVRTLIDRRILALKQGDGKQTQSDAPQTQSDDPQENEQKTSGDGSRGKFGFCIYCGRKADKYCLQTSDPVCDRTCKQLNIQGLTHLTTNFTEEKGETGARVRLEAAVENMRALRFVRKHVHAKFVMLSKDCSKIFAWLCKISFDGPSGSSSSRRGSTLQVTAGESKGESVTKSVVTKTPTAATTTTTTTTTPTPTNTSTTTEAPSTDTAPSSSTTTTPTAGSETAPKEEANAPPPPPPPPPTGELSLGSTAGSNKVNIQTKCLSLKLILSILEQNYRLVRENATYAHIIRTCLLSSIVVACGSDVDTLFSLAAAVYVHVCLKFRSLLHRECMCIYRQVIMKWLDSPQVSFRHKLRGVEVVNSLFSSHSFVVDMFLNYDCRLYRFNVLQQTIHILKGVCLGKLCNFFSQALVPGSSTTNQQHNGDWVSADQSQKLRQAALDSFSSLFRSLHFWVGIKQRQDLVTTAEQKEQDEGKTQGSSTVQAFMQERKRKIGWDACKESFAHSAKKGMKLLLSHGFTERSPEAIARLFLDHADELDRRQIGEYMSEPQEFNEQVLQAYVETMDFTGLKFDEAIRLYLAKFWLPGEAQKIDRMMNTFAAKFHTQNPDIFQHEDTAYVLAYSTIMLNTDAHSVMVKKKMTKEEFFRNNRGIDNGQDVSAPLLNELYERITRHQIMMETDADAAPTDGDDQVVQSRAEKFAAEAQRMVKGTLVALQRIPVVPRLAPSKPVAESKEEEQPMEKAGASQVQDRSFFYTATEADFMTVQPMVEMFSFPILMVFGTYLEQSRERKLWLQCLQTITYGIKLGAVYGIETAREAFTGALSKFIYLRTRRGKVVTDRKYIDGYLLLLELAGTVGNYLGPAWNMVFFAISEWKVVQDLSQKRVTPPKASPKSSTLRAPTGEAAEQIQQAKVVMQACEGSAAGVAKVFAMRAGLTQDALRHYMVALCNVCIFELFGKDYFVNLIETSAGRTVDTLLSGADKPVSDEKEEKEESVDGSPSSEVKRSNRDNIFQAIPPSWLSGPKQAMRRYSSDKLAGVCSFLLSVPGVAWENLWSVLGPFLTRVSCHSNQQLALWTVDVLRQVTTELIRKLVKNRQTSSVQEDGLLLPYARIIAHCVVEVDARVKRSQQKTQGDDPYVMRLEFIFACLERLVYAGAARDEHEHWNSVLEILKSTVELPCAPVVHNLLSFVALFADRVTSSKYIVAAADMAVGATVNEVVTEESRSKALAIIEKCAIKLADQRAAADVQFFRLLSGVSDLIHQATESVRLEAIQALRRILFHWGAVHEKRTDEDRQQGWIFIFKGFFFPLFDLNYTVFEHFGREHAVCLLDFGNMSFYRNTSKALLALMKELFVKFVLSPQEQEQELQQQEKQLQKSQQSEQKSTKAIPRKTSYASVLFEHFLTICVAHMVAPSKAVSLLGINAYRGLMSAWNAFKAAGGAGGRDGSSAPFVDGGGGAEKFAVCARYLFSRYFGEIRRKVAVRRKRGMSTSASKGQLQVFFTSVPQEEKDFMSSESGNAPGLRAIRNCVSIYLGMCETLMGVFFECEGQQQSATQDQSEENAEEQKGRKARPPTQDTGKDAEFVLMLRDGKALVESVRGYVSQVQLTAREGNEGAQDDHRHYINTLSVFEWKQLIAVFVQQCNNLLAMLNGDTNLFAGPQTPSKPPPPSQQPTAQPQKAQLPPEEDKSDREVDRDLQLSHIYMYAYNSLMLFRIYWFLSATLHQRTSSKDRYWSQTLQSFVLPEFSRFLQCQLNAYLYMHAQKQRPHTSHVERPDAGEDLAHSNSGNQFVDCDTYVLDSCVALYFSVLGQCFKRNGGVLDAVVGSAMDSGNVLNLCVHPPLKVRTSVVRFLRSHQYCSLGRAGGVSGTTGKTYNGGSSTKSQKDTPLKTPVVVNDEIVMIPEALTPPPAALSEDEME